MLLKKPYAMIIKHFKLIHIILTIISFYLIYRTNILLKFFNNYLENQTSVIGQNLRDNTFSLLIFVFCFISLLITIVLLWTMLAKKKPYKFYLINIIIILSTILLAFYCYNFIGLMEVSVVDILSVRVIRDLLLILLSSQGLSLIVLFVRAVGFDIKKFEFMSDLQELDLSNEDMEEIEVEFNIDSNERKRKRRRNLRYLKYSYQENKIFIIGVLVVLLIVSLIFIFSRFSIYSFDRKEDEYLNTDYYNYKVLNSYLINTSYKGIKITDNYLVVLNLNIKKNGFQNKIITGNFKLQVGYNKYNSTNMYDKYITDLGNVYKNEELTNDYQNYLLVYEVPIKEIDNNMKLLYLENGNSVKVKLNPIKYIKDNKEYNLGDEVVINDSDTIRVNNYEISDKFTINYNFCVKTDCYNSIQYLVPTLDTNYDKTIMKINGEFIKKNNAKYNNFSNILSSIGFIEYKIGDNVYTSNLTRITSIKKEEKNIYYYEVNKDILSSDSIKLVFSTRKCKYSYILK